MISGDQRPTSKFVSTSTFCHFFFSTVHGHLCSVNRSHQHKHSQHRRIPSLNYFLAQSRSILGSLHIFSSLTSNQLVGITGMSMYVAMLSAPQPDSTLPISLPWAHQVSAHLASGNEHIVARIGHLRKNYQISVHPCHLHVHLTKRPILEFELHLSRSRRVLTQRIRAVYMDCIALIHTAQIPAETVVA